MLAINPPDSVEHHKSRSFFARDKVVLSLLPADAHSVNSQMNTEELQIVIPYLK